VFLCFGFWLAHMLWSRTSKLFTSVLLAAHHKYTPSLLFSLPSSFFHSRVVPPPIYVPNVFWSSKKHNPLDLLFFPCWTLISFILSFSRDVISHGSLYWWRLDPYQWQYPKEEKLGPGIHQMERWGGTVVFKHPGAAI
jgi:hypothetical protein